MGRSGRNRSSGPVDRALRARQLRRFHAHLVKSRPYKHNLLAYFSPDVLADIDLLIGNDTGAPGWETAPAGEETFDMKWDNRSSLTTQLSYIKRWCREKEKKDAAEGTGTSDGDGDALSRDKNGRGQDQDRDVDGDARVADTGAGLSVAETQEDSGLDNDQSNQNQTAMAPGEALAARQGGLAHTVLDQGPMPTSFRAASGASSPEAAPPLHHGSYAVYSRPSVSLAPRPVNQFPVSSSASSAMLAPGCDAVPFTTAKALISNLPMANTAAVEAAIRGRRQSSFATAVPIPDANTDTDAGTAHDEAKGKEAAVFLTTPPPRATPLPTVPTSGLDSRDARDLDRMMREQQVYSARYREIPPEYHAWLFASRDASRRFRTLERTSKEREEASRRVSEDKARLDALVAVSGALPSTPGRRTGAGTVSELVNSLTGLGFGPGEDEPDRPQGQRWRMAYDAWLESLGRYRAAQDAWAEADEVFRLAESAEEEAAQAWEHTRAAKPTSLSFHQERASEGSLGK
ncbi:hypothetical protein ColTof4_13608 [Colletotrichum tofieldiae]|nr:hypothetical protein ColTof3_14560 [Colletotrichum tofieldiae]GKT81185.1 hypothetical protein ColTof4_13608 [Colletotrichum tofieldiae]